MVVESIGEDDHVDDEEGEFGPGLRLLRSRIFVFIIYIREEIEKGRKDIDCVAM